MHVVRASALAVVVGSCLLSSEVASAQPGGGPGPSRDRAATASQELSPSPYKSMFVEVNGASLNYLDWGGTGPYVVMIHGIGDNPHIFDDLALLLRGRFHLIAYARRGHGHSESKPPFDGDTLTQDMRGLLDKLGIQRASFIGWSMGGNEITEFAGRYPERVSKLVYLDAGYDWSSPEFSKPFEDALTATGPSAADGSSFDALRAWYRRVWLGNKVKWTPGLEAYLLDEAQPDAAGALHPKPTDETYGALLMTLGEWKRDYTKVKAPALAIYATTFFPLDTSDPAQRQKLGDFNDKTMRPFRRESMERIKRELPGVRIEQIADRTHMSVGIEEPRPVATTIGAFLLAPVER